MWRVQEWGTVVVGCCHSSLASPCLASFTAFISPHMCAALNVGHYYHVLHCVLRGLPQRWCPSAAMCLATVDVLEDPSAG